MLPHALTSIDRCVDRWRASGKLVLLLDFDGTLAPIAARPDVAKMLEETRRALSALCRRDDVAAAVVSGRGLADVRQLVDIPGIAYAGNHGMEIEGPGMRQVHPEAVAARPELSAVLAELRRLLACIPGVLIEDKGLTLSVHHRQAAREHLTEVYQVLDRVVGSVHRVRLTRGKEVLEVRPRVDWNKGHAVEFLLDRLRPPPGAPIFYLGDDVTDEDAFRALTKRQQGWPAGIVVADPAPSDTAASGYLRCPEEVGMMLRTLEQRAPV